MSRVEELELKRKTFEAGNEGALYDALKLCQDSRVTLPDWLFQALLGVLRERWIPSASKRRGRRARWLEGYKQDRIDSLRADTVLDALNHGIRWIDVYAVASSILEGTEAGSTPDGIEKSYKRYKRRLRKDPYRYHELRYVKYDPDPKRPSTRGQLEVWKEIQRMRHRCVACGGEIDLSYVANPKTRRRCESCQPA